MKDDLVLTIKNQQAMQLVSDNGNLDKVSDMLMEQLAVLKTNPGEIERTRAMCDVAGRIIDAQKTKVMAVAALATLHNAMK